MENSKEYLQVFISVSSKSEIEKITKILLEKNLVACVQVLGPMESTYKWKGKIEKAKEWLCILKTKQSLYQKVEEEIKNIHSYEVPEIVAVPITKGSEDYLNWVDKSLKRE